MAIDNGAPPAETGASAEFNIGQRYEVAAKRLMENPAAVQFTAFGVTVANHFDFAGKLGLSNPQESAYIPILVTDRFIRDRHEKRVANREVVGNVAEKFFPKFVRNLRKEYVDKEDTTISEGERVFSEYFEVAREAVRKSVEEPRARTIESAVHEILTMGLVNGGKQGDWKDFGNSTFKLSDEDIEQWSNRWRSKLETTAKGTPSADNSPTSS